MSDAQPLWIDSHAHLTMEPPSEVGPTLERAVAVGVAGVLVPATGPEDLQRTLDIGADHPERTRIAIGVHPHDARLLDAAFQKRMETVLSAPGVIAIGEIGLDYHYMNSPREEQIRAFGWQLDFAIDVNLPVVIHNRDSWEDMEKALRAREGRLRGVCHSFTEDGERAMIVQNLGLYVGISGMITFKKAENIRAMATAVSLDRLLVETDSPFLAPVPHRGQRNQPAWVTEVGKAVAAQHRVSVQDVATMSARNVESLFGWTVTPLP